MDRRHLPLNLPLEHSLDRLPNYIIAKRAAAQPSHLESINPRTAAPTISSPHGPLLPLNEPLTNAGRIDLRPYHRTAIHLLLHQIRHCLTTILTLTPAAWASDHTSALLVACICSLYH